MLKVSKPQSPSPTPSFYQHFKTPLKNLNFFATVVEVIIILTVDLLVTLDIDLVLTRARILVLDTMINLTLTTILLITTVISLDMTNINQNPNKSYSSSSRPNYNSISSRSPSKNYPRSRERSSSYNNSSFKRYNSPYRPPSKPRNDRYRSRSH